MENVERKTIKNIINFFILFLLDFHKIQSPVCFSSPNKIFRSPLRARRKARRSLFKVSASK
ncbi:hypothetical protein V6Z11_D01G226200 [Gossypium hirsutum]